MQDRLKDLLIETLMESDEFVDALEAVNPSLKAKADKIVELESHELMVAAEVMEGRYKAHFTDATRNVLTIE